MKSIHLSSLWILFLLLFQGCQEEKQKNSTHESTQVKGKTTIYSGFKEEMQGIVCIDINQDKVCNKNEPQTTIDHQGNYEFNRSVEIHHGDTLLLIGGKSLLPPHQKSAFIFSKFYDEEEKNQNINIMSSVIMNALEKNVSLSYGDAVKKIVTLYRFDRERLLSNPLDNKEYFFEEDKAYVKFITALEMKLKDKSAKRDKEHLHKFIFFPLPDSGGGEQNSTLPTAEEVDVVVQENEDLFDAFFDLLSEYYDYILSWFSDDTSLEEGDSDLSFEAPAVKSSLTREELNGSWYLVDASGDKVCTTVYGNDTVLVIEATGERTNLTLGIKGEEGDIEAIELTYGAFGSEIINLVEYTTDHKFKGIYASDNETLIGTKMLNSEVCNRELGL